MRTETRHLAEARIGTRLDGKWVLDALLGWGGSAAVYAATHRNGKRAAIKILHAHCMSDELLVSRFVREGYLANKIQHPGIVSVLDDNTAVDGSVYLVMELLDGASLERHGRGLAPPLSFLEVARIGNDVLDVLVAAHAGGLIHRDIKPANLFITRSGQLKVLDFGIARIAESNVEGATQTGMMMGTPAFMPPEQARARWHEVDARSDLWALGATMMTLLLGKRPRVADTANEELLLAMTEPLPPIGSLRQDLPSELASVIDRAVAFDRAARWQSAHEMQQALRAAVASYDIDGPQSVTMLIEPNSALAQRLSSSAELAVAAQTTVLTPHAHVSSAPGFASSGHPPTPTPSSTPSMPAYPAAFAAHASPMRAMPELETPPSLTTHRAVLQSARPGAGSKISPARILAAGAVLMLCAMIAGGALYLRGRRSMAESTARSAAASAPPPSASPPTAAEVGAPPETAPPAPAEPSSTVSAPATPLPVVATATAATATSRSEVKRDPKSPPRGPASTDPDKFLDRRF